MTIYIADYDNNKVVKKGFGKVDNLEAFERELDELYPEQWFYDEIDAVYDLKDYNFSFAPEDIVFNWGND